MSLKLFTIGLMAGSIMITAGCMTKTPTNQPNLLEPVSPGASGTTTSPTSKYVIVTGDTSLLTDSYIKDIVSQLNTIEKTYQDQTIPETKSGSLEIATSNLLVRVIKGATPGQESIEIQDGTKRHIAPFPYVTGNKQTLLGEECKGEQVFAVDDPLCNLPRVMGLYGPFDIMGVNMIIYTLSQPNGILSTRAISLSSYKDVQLPFRPVRYSTDKKLLIAREGTGNTYRIIGGGLTGGLQLANGQQIDGLSVNNGTIYAYQFDNESENNTSTLRVIDSATNTIRHILKDIDIGQVSYFLQDETNPDTVYVKYNKVFFATEQQKDYIMKLDLKTATIERLVQL